MLTEQPIESEEEAPTAVMTNEELTNTVVEIFSNLLELRLRLHEVIGVLNLNSVALKQHKEAITKLSGSFEEMDARLDIIKSRIKGETT